MRELQFGTAVIGAGISGLVAAVRLSELGIRTVVLEQGNEEKYPCNTRIAGGAFHVAHQDVADDKQVIFDAINKRTGGTVRPDLVDAVASDIGEATRWLRTKGVRFIKVGVAIDGTGHVLDTEDKPIPNLYAAGCATGGLEGGSLERVAYIGGLTKSTVIGLRAANDIGARIAIAAGQAAIS